MELTKPSDERVQQLKALIPVLILSIIFSSIMFFTFWDRVASLDLWDDDDYMRLVQISEWVATGSWYLQPLERLNPQDGQIIHWTRVPDIVPYTLIKALSTITDLELATLISISITPLLYLCTTVVLIAATTSKLFGNQYAFVSAVYALSSYLLVKFLPGSIDHHNVQLCISAFFILLIPTKEAEFKYQKRAWIQGMLVALSVWVGVANILFFITALSVLVIYGIYKNRSAVEYVSSISLSAFFFSLVFIVCNRPYSEFFYIHVDAISIAFSSCFLSGYIFCITFIKLKNISKVIATLSSLIISLIPTFCLFPELLSDIAYQDNPEVLKLYWLNFISETYSTTHYIVKDGFFTSTNIALVLAPAVASICFLKNPSNKNFYYIFIISLAIPFFWQNRASIAPILLAIPLQSYFSLQLASKTEKPIYKLIVILLMSPIFIGALLDLVSRENNEDFQVIYTPTHDNKLLTNLVSQLDLSQSKILAPVDFGSRILAVTEAKVVSAPYHRNIRGNKLMIDTFLDTDIENVKEKIYKNKITHIIIGNSKQSKILKIKSKPDSFINKLDKNEIPRWLTLIYKEGNISVFKAVKITEGRNHEL